MDAFYRLLIASAVISFVLGALLLAFLGHGLLGNLHDKTNLVSTNVNPTYNYETQRNNAVKSS